MRRLRVSHVAVNPSYGLIDVAIHGNQIEAPVQVDIEKRAAKAEAGARRLAHSAILRRVLVNAFAAEAVQRHHFVIEVGDGDALGAGVVEVGGVHAHTGARFTVVAERDSRPHADIFKRAVSQIAVQLVGLRVVGDQ